MDAFWAAPPVTRTITALTFAESALLFSGILPGKYVIFQSRYILKLFPELWRPFSSFFVTKSGFAFFFDIYHMYQYGSAIERDSPWFTGPGDFFVYVLFVGTVILLTAGCYFGFVIYTSALIMAFVYTYARANQGMKVKFFMIQLPVEFLPWAFAVFDLIAYGKSAAILSVTGIVAAHSHDFLTRIYPTFGGGRNYLATPPFVKRFFSKYTPNRVYRSYGTAFHRSETQSPSNSSWTSSLQGSWSTRGRGRRLGGD